MHEDRGVIFYRTKNKLGLSYFLKFSLITLAFMREFATSSFGCQLERRGQMTL